jgi:hypothetical protein
LFSLTNRLYNRSLGSTLQQHTDMQKIQYQTPKIQKLDLVYSVLFYIYYLLLVILGYTVFITNTSWPMVLKITLTVIFLLFPFVISTLEYYGMKWGFMVYYYCLGAPIGGNPVERNIKNTTMVERPYDGILPLSNPFKSSTTTL